MIRMIKIGKLNISLVFKHRFESDLESKYLDWKSWKICAWFKKYKIVAFKNFKSPSEWSHVGSYQFGLECLIIKGWITFDYGGMHL